MNFFNAETQRRRDRSWSSELELKSCGAEEEIFARSQYAGVGSY